MLLFFRMGDFYELFHDDAQGGEAARHHPDPARAIGGPADPDPGCCTTPTRLYLARLVVWANPLPFASRSATRPRVTARSTQGGAHRHPRHGHRRGLAAGSPRHAAARGFARQVGLRPGLGRTLRRALPGQRSGERRRARGRTPAAAGGNVAAGRGRLLASPPNATACAGARRGCSTPIPAAASCCSSSACTTLPRSASTTSSPGTYDAAAAARLRRGNAEAAASAPDPISVEASDGAIAMNAATPPPELIRASTATPAQPCRRASHHHADGGCPLGGGCIRRLRDHGVAATNCRRDGWRTAPGRICARRSARSATSSAIARIMLRICVCATFDPCATR